MPAQAILDFWFGKPEARNYGKPRKYWFSKRQEFDEEIRSRFLSTYRQAAEGKLNHWQEQPLSCLALIILLDQFPRNMFRDRPQAFATDARALEFAQYALTRGFDRQLLPVQRWFIYLPLEHSENLEHQQQAVRLFSTLKIETRGLGNLGTGGYILSQSPPSFSRIGDMGTWGEFFSISLIP